MSKLDPRLKFIQGNRKTEQMTELLATGRFALESVEAAAPAAKVLIQFDGDLSAIEALGFEPRTVTPTVASGVVPLDRLDEIAALDGVVKIESSRPLQQELDESLPEVRADRVHRGPPSYRGSGVVIGIIDSGIDYTHPVFRKPNGSSRILAVWDQGASPAPGSGEAAPSGYTYGVEYTKTEIDAALSDTDPHSVVRHRDRDPRSGHGTHVTGIAAGDGSAAGNGERPFTFVGMAPEAEIILVANAVTTAAIGDSANTLDAVRYIFDKAEALGKPVVINLSQGDNLGPHDGTSLLEQGIDHLLGGPGRAMVKSAGNAADDSIHAAGTVPAGGIETVRFVVPAGDTSPDTLDLWYSGGDRFSITITTPGGAAGAAVAPGETSDLSLPNGNRVFVDSALDDPNNHDNRIYIQLSRGTAAAVEPGTWSFSLQGVEVTDGSFDAWIERGDVVPAFLRPHLSNSRTITVPGTSREIITVGSYITKGGGVRNLSAFSGRGPTRDGRPAPTLTAPGQWIMSARAAGISSGSDRYHLLAGTSMAAPHVAGAVALMLGRDRDLTQAEVRESLTATAREDGFTGTVPNRAWGHGRLDVEAAVDRVSGARPRPRDKP